MYTDERGVTLVELLAVFVIGAIISVLATAMLLSGFKINDRVLSEAKLRDEADLIMASLIRDLYVLKLSEVESNEFNPATGTYLIKTKNNQQIGFTQGEVMQANGEKLKLYGSVKISEGTKIVQKSPAQYEITLALEDENTSKVLNVKSEVGLINDTGG